MAESNDPSFLENFCCRICLNVLHDPVQCQNNEHYFCRQCIMKHLANSETCPMCMDQLTVETLRPPSRIVSSIVSQLKKPGCSHVSRGCTENVKADELLLHEQTCGYAPVVCSNEGCKQTVNRRDKESHETKECKFRKITCEDCDEEMIYVDYEKHQCTLRKEMNEMKARLDEINGALTKFSATQNTMLEKLTAHENSIKDIQNPLLHFSSATIKRGNTVVRGQIFIFSGQSLEIFNWSTKAWTLIQNCLFFQCKRSFSFQYSKRITICGGDGNRIEFLNPSENGFTSIAFPGCLPSDNSNGVLFENRIISFDHQVHETSLESPYKSTVLIQGGNIDDKYINATNSRGLCALERFDSDIFIIGFKGNQLERYNINKNEIANLTSLPYQVYNMTTVAYKDNLVILGGQSNFYYPNEYTQSLPHALNDVLMYNTHSLECKRLPSMLEARSACSAIVMGDVIVVMGGKTKKRTNYGRWETEYLKTVEYYVIGDTTWRKLPDMNLAKAEGTACMYV